MIQEDSNKSYDELIEQAEQSADGKLRDKDGKPVELRSEELHEVLGSVPAWILRRGIYLVGVIVVILLVGSWFFKYPEIISSTMVLSGTTPASPVVARTNGRIMKMYAHDNQLIKEGEYLAVLENPANTEDVYLLKQYLQKLLVNTDNIPQLPKKEFKLGNIQSGFSSLSRSLDSYNKFIELDYYPQKLKVIKQRIDDYNKQYANLERQNKIIKEQHDMRESFYIKDSMTFINKWISPVEMDQSKNQYLQSKLSLENSYSSMANMKIQIKQLEESVLDTEQQYNEKQSAYIVEITNLAIQLTNEINTWEMTYVLVAPFTGTVTFNNYWSENQNVMAGETVFIIVPEKSGDMIGKALLPAARSGKVEVGQKVNIKFANYPENEYGIVWGKVKNISLVPVEGNYTVEIALPNGLMTTYRKELPFSPEMQAQADIVTDDLRLIERLFMPIKKVFAN